MSLLPIPISSARELQEVAVDKKLTKSSDDDEENDADEENADEESTRRLLTDNENSGGESHVNHFILQLYNYSHSFVKFCKDFIENNYNVAILFGIKGFRMFSFGFLALMLVIYLRALKFSYVSIGSIFFWTLVGDCLISLYLTSRADYFGRKNTLIIGSFLGIITSIIFALFSNYYVLLITSIFGVISPSGGEVGPFMAVELSALTQLVSEADRTILIAYYNLIGSFSVALGAITCGAVMGMTSLFIEEVESPSSNSDYYLLQSCRVALVVYALIQVAVLLLVYKLSIDIEVSETDSIAIKEVNPSTLFLGLHKSKVVVVKLSLLFLIDSFAGSFIMQSLISSWFKSTYDTSLSKLGAVLFVCNLVAAVSCLFAAKLAEKIGLIMTMFVTHMPSNVLSILVPLMPNESCAILVLCLRYSISQMDIPTRNSYVQSVVDSTERSAANGVLNVVRTFGSAMGPFVAASLYESESTRNYPFYIAGVLKIIYDLLLVYSMSEIRPKQSDNNKDAMTIELSKSTAVVSLPVYSSSLGLDLAIKEERPK